MDDLERRLSWHLHAAAEAMPTLPAPDADEAIARAGRTRGAGLGRRAIGLLAIAAAVVVIAGAGVAVWSSQRNAPITAMPAGPGSGSSAGALAHEVTVTVTSHVRMALHDVSVDFAGQKLDVGTVGAGATVAAGQVHAARAVGFVAFSAGGVTVQLDLATPGTLTVTDPVVIDIIQDKGGSYAATLRSQPAGMDSASSADPTSTATSCAAAEPYPTTSPDSSQKTSPAVRDECRDGAVTAVRPTPTSTASD